MHDRVRWASQTDEERELTHAVAEHDLPLEARRLDRSRPIPTWTGDLDIPTEQNPIAARSELRQVEVLEDLVRLLADDVVRDMAERLETLSWREGHVDAARAEKLHVDHVVLFLAVDAADWHGAGLEDGGGEEVVVGGAKVEIDGDWNELESVLRLIAVALGRAHPRRQTGP